MNFKDRTCVVTGGANGIGRAIVETFLSRGANVAFIDSDEQSGMRLLRTFGEARLFFFHGDLARDEVCAAFSARVIERFLSVDYLVNNACASKKGLLSGCSAEDFNEILRLGVTAPYLLSRYFSPAFTKRAAIVNICSTRAFMSQADTESYSAAKGGIAALTHALAASFAGRVRVNAISPGWIDTGAYQKADFYRPQYEESDTRQHPAGRVGTPADIAAAVCFLCGDDAGFITGENLVVDGGMTRLMIYSGDEGWRYTPAISE